ncbi:hypothetical protein [Luteolibacter soli]|uniref:Uncharacterized protein n=1 Tax=Luteolibacter soli TaxID=3135280 RepID=A0ABU9AZ60_9BACT
MTIFRRPIRDLVVWFVFAAAAAYSLYKGLQFSFAACSLVCLGITWKKYTIQIFDLVKGRLARISQAKFGDLSITADPADPVLRALSKIIESQPWMASLIEGLGSSHLSLLALANDNPGHKAHTGQEAVYRDLRARGMISSNGPIGQGGEVSPTSLGKQVLETLRSLRADLAQIDQNPEESNQQSRV